MPDANYVQSSFLGGEWSLYAQGRFDKPDYRNAMNVCFNSMPLEEGCCTRRPGERFLATTRNGFSGRLLSYDFEAAAPYNMEFTDGHLRFFGSKIDGPMQLVTTNDDAAVSLISTDDPAKVTTGAQSWSSGDQVFFNFGLAPAAFVPLVRNRVFQITVIDSTHFSIIDPLTNAPIDGSTLGWGSGVPGITVSRVADLASPYVGAQWEDTRSIQADLGAVLLNSAYAPRLVSETPPTETEFATFDLSTVTFLDGPYLDPPKIGTLTPSALSGTITLSGAPSGTFASTDVGRMMRLFSEPAQWVAGTTYFTDEVVTYQGAYYVALQSTTGNIPGADAENWGVASNVAVWVWGLITIVNSDTEVTFAIDASGLLAPALLYTAPIDAALGNWQLGLYSSVNAQPTCGTYHEGRLWLSGSVPNRIDSSMSNKTFTMSPTTTDGTVADNNGISYIFNATEQNPVFWMQPAAAGIVCGTQGGEWLVQASALNDPLTPTSIQAHRVTKYGCANIEPRETGLTIVFVQRWMRKLFEYFPDVFSGRYMAPNLSVNAAHITHDGIEEIAFQKERTPVIWARTAAGALAGITYKRDSLMSSQGPEFAGWHRHALGSGRTVDSICVGPSQFGNLDGLSMVTTGDTNVRHVGMLTDMFDENDLLTSAWFLDDAIVPAGGIIDYAAQTLTFTGLWHLNGKTATAFVAGLDGGDAVVANGEMTIPLRDGLESALSYDYLKNKSSQPASNAPGALGLLIPIDNASIERFMIPAVVGCAYTSQGQGLRKVAPQEAGAANGPALGKTQRAHQFVALIANAITGTVKFGTDFDHLRAAAFKTKGNKAIPVDQLYSGVHQGTIDDEYGFNSMICWQIDRPLPLTVAAFGGFLNTQDR